MAEINETADTKTASIILHNAFFYDFVVWLAMRGRGSEFRAKTLQLARLKPGESVLDVGCGTGTLAIKAKKFLGPSSHVQGMDASPEMIARAKKKALKASLEIEFVDGRAESLPFPDGKFDAALATLMLHHLAPKTRRACIAEIRRILKPGGRVLIVDFAPSVPLERKDLIDLLHRRHGNLKFGELETLAREAGLTIIESGAFGMKDLQFVLARLDR